jgi:uncharacterized protein (DUF849 family)
MAPLEIATSAIDAAKAGAAMVHIHVRHVATGAAGGDHALYRDVAERIAVADP